MLKFRPFNLKTRILLWVSLLVLIAIWGLAWRVTAVLRADLEQIVAGQLSATVDYAVNDLDNKIQLRIETLQEIAASITPQVLAEPAKLNHLLAQRNVSRHLFPIGIFVANRQGINIAEYPWVDGRLGGSVADRDYFRGIMAGGGQVIGKPIKGRFWKQAISAIALPLRDASGTAVGVLIGALVLSNPELFGQLEQVRIGRTGFFLVVSPKDRLIVSATDKDRVLTPLPAPGVNPILDQRIDTGIENVAIGVNSLGVENLTVSRNLGTTGWIAIIGIATEEAFAPIEKLKWQIYLVALAISLALVLVLRYVLVRQLAPLAEASEAMGQMTREDKPFAALPVRHDDEIGQMVKNFNSLVVERQRMDQALHISEERWKFALEGAGDGVWDWNVQTGEVNFSRRWKEMLGYSDSEIGSDYHEWKKLVHPDDLAGALATIQAYSMGEMPDYVIEHRLLCKDGSWKWILSRGMIVSRMPDGKPLRMIGTHSDISKLKQVEADLRAKTEDLLHANADLTRFTEVSAHHLMEPTRRLVSYAQFLRAHLLEPRVMHEDEEVRVSLDTLEHDAGRLRGLVRDIQLYLAAGEPRGDVKMEDANAALLAVEHRLAPQIAAHGVQLDFQPLPPANLDRQRLMDLFAVLLENALRHGRPVDPKLLPEIHIHGERDGALSRYHVSDNGPGIPAEYLERVFEIFERLGPGSAGADAESGTGIGLSIARRIVESRHGRIWIENLPRGGAMVAFELPDGETQ